jgi:putative oxidoreductase
MNKIPQFSQVVEVMKKEGVPMPQVALVGAIAFLLVGGASVVLGYKARIGALLLLVFVALATYYFHDFWNMPEASAQEVQNEMAHFMKNAALAGAMIFIIANGSGAGSLDRCCPKEVGKT